MKAILRLRPALAAITSTIVLATVLGSCSQPRVVPAPTPAPTPTPSRPVPMPEVDWRDAPITPGNWEWSIEEGKSVASFAGGLLALRCDRAEGMVTLLRRGDAAGQVPMTIVTGSGVRALNAAGSGSRAAIAVSFRVNDPFLDAMAFSRGRFAVQTAGLPTLYVPSWPEVTRVIEDCR